MSTDRRKRVLALIVTYGKRADILRRSAVAAFEAGINELLVVDNAASFDVSEALRDALSEISYERTKVLALQRNLGSAGGFEAGLRWFNTHFSCDFVILLDDDNLLPPQAIERYLYWFSKDRGFNMPDRRALLAVRGGNHLVSRHGPKIQFIPGRSSFLNFSIADFPRRILRKIKLLQIRQTVWQGGYIELEFGGYYGGLFLHRSLLDRAGYPDSDMFLYGDDVEYILRMQEAGARIYLVPDIKITEVESTWSETTHGNNRWSQVFNSSSDLRVYCMVRNGVYLTLFRRRANRPLYFLNRQLSLSIFWLYSLFSRNWERYKLIRSAVRAGEARNLGAPQELLKLTERKRD